MSVTQRAACGGKPMLPHVQVISVAHPPATTRSAARAAIRLALRELVADLFHLALDQVLVVTTPGAAPRLLLDGRPVLGGISFSHDGEHSYAAYHDMGPVGVDLMRVQPVPDWEALARDYLGPAVLQQLQSLDDGQRPRRFAQAWTEREAVLKSAGLALAEWLELPGKWDVLPVEAPDGYVAAVATRL